MTITKPGTIINFPAETYHDCPTPEFPLSAGFIDNMQGPNGSPAVAWFKSNLNPRFVPENSQTFDIGSAAHLILLEEHLWKDRVVFVDAEDYRTNAAKASRDAAYAAKKIPLLPKHADQVLDMRAAFHNALPGLPFATAPDFAARGLSGGQAEVSVFARDEEFGIWMKCRPDYVRRGDARDTLVDYKTMALGGQDIKRYAENMGWKQRAAWYSECWQRATGRECDYWYIGQDKEAPHFVRCYRMSDRAIEWGHRLNKVQKRVFAECMKSGVWPSNVGSVETIELSEWDERRLQDREEEGYFMGRVA